MTTKIFGTCTDDYTVERWRNNCNSLYVLKSKSWRISNGLVQDSFQVGFYMLPISTGIIPMGLRTGRVTTMSVTTVCTGTIGVTLHGTSSRLRWKPWKMPQRTEMLTSSYGQGMLDWNQLLAYVHVTWSFTKCTVWLYFVVHVDSVCNFTYLLQNESII